MIRIPLTLLVIATAVTAVSGAVYHVPQGFAKIQNAVLFAADGDTVLVSDGTYTGVGNRNIDFVGKSITVLSLNGPAETVIDCMNRGRGFYFGSGEDEGAVLKGFTIRNGRDNTGGGIFCLDASPRIKNCIITGNKASSGGGIYCSMSFPEISGSTISGNAAYFGGAVWCWNSIPVFVNCILWGDSGDEIYATLGNPVITYSDIQGGFPGDGNIDADPLFEDPDNGDFHLGACSPCIDNGKQGDYGSDLDGQPRPYPREGNIDMGVDERWPRFEIQIIIEPDIVERGEKFHVAYSLYNPELWDVSLDTWLDAYMPNGKPFPDNPLKGPLSFYLWSHQPFQGVVGVTVDENAPVGSYKIYLETADPIDGVSFGSQFDTLQVVY